SDFSNDLYSLYDIKSTSTDSESIMDHNSALELEIRFEDNNNILELE
ncbi:3316_t:CDS:1, partial [Cetraspora pellucida]